MILTKKYKDREPVDTVNYIKTILAKNKIFTIDHLHEKNVETYPSCSVYLAEKNILRQKVLTNGKGRDLEYTYASAYAEFMERLQNNLLNFRFNSLFRRIFNDINYINENFETDHTFQEFLNKNEIKIKYIFSPDEVSISLKEIKEKYWYYLASQKFDIKKLDRALNEFSENQKLLCLPFFSLRKKSIEYLPIDFIHTYAGSNGMCAGNNRTEALVQGICELLERYAQKIIYNKEICPPSIPKEVFKGTAVLEQIIKFEKEKNCKIEIKDCSLGEGFPVIAVVYYSKTNQEYVVNFGADPSPEIALERCMTELNQGSLHLKSKKIDYSVNPYKEEDKKQTKNYNYYLVYTTNSGKWPLNFFMDSYDYEFEGFKFNEGISKNEDLMNLITLIENNGFEIYIRDVSFLKFPSYHVYIPGMSEFQDHLGTNSLKNNKLLIDNMRLFLNISKISVQESTQVISAIEQLYNLSEISFKNYNDLVQFLGDDDFQQLDINTLLFLLYYKTNDLENALKYLKIYISKQKETYSYFSCVRDFVSLLIRYRDIDKCKKILLKHYKNSEVEEVINDLNINNNIFRYYKLPQCFNCSTCHFYGNCVLLNLIRHESKLDALKERFYPSQKQIEEILSN